MGSFREKVARLGAMGAVTALGVAGFAALAPATPAFAGTTPVPITQTWAFPGPTGFAQLQTVAAAASPATVPQGGNFTITLPGGSQSVPTTNSGVAVNYIEGNAQYYEIPAGTTYVSSTGGSLTWTGGLNASLPASGSAALTITDCTAAGQTGCTAASNSALVANASTGTFSGFAGPNPGYPYLEVSTGTTQIPAGATLTLPTVTVTLQAGANTAGGTVLNWSQFEFDTIANVTLFGNPASAPVVAYPSAPYTGTLPDTTSGIPYSAPPVLTSTTVVGPQISVTNTPPINIPGTNSSTINVTGSNWPASDTGTLAWSGGNGADTDAGTFTVNASGVLTGTIPLSLAEQSSSDTSAFALTLTATDTAAKAATSSVTVNPYQSFATTCVIGAAPNSTCTINDQIGTTVTGTTLTISEVTTAPNASAKAVTLSPVTLGIGAGTNNQQFDQAQGLLNTVVVSDDRGTLGGWSVTGQMTGDFTNTTPVGPTADNVIPADFLTWQPAVALETPGSLPGNNANVIGCPDQTPAPTGYPSCAGPSGLPVPLNGTAQGTPGSAGVNGTAAGTGGVSSTPAEVTAGIPAVLNNLAGSPASLCTTASAASPGGGGGFLCSAGLSLAVPPYVAAGTYQATMNIVVIGY